MVIIRRNPDGSIASREGEEPKHNHTQHYQQEEA
tara:strand:+ start:292 stop:393 length:102 start_codon:yes stop_codon:yes gene_type:complete